MNFDEKAKSDDGSCKYEATLAATIENCDVDIFYEIRIDGIFWLIIDGATVNPTVNIDIWCVEATYVFKDEFVEVDPETVNHTITIGNTVNGIYQIFDIKNVVTSRGYDKTSYYLIKNGKFAG